MPIADVLYDARRGLQSSRYESVSDNAVGRDEAGINCITLRGCDLRILASECSISETEIRSKLCSDCRNEGGPNSAMAFDGKSCITRTRLRK